MGDILEMENFNISVALCESYDQENMSAIKFFNEVHAENNKAQICIFSMINYVGLEDVGLGLDYFIKCIKPEDIEYQDTKIALFSIEAKGRKQENINGYKVFESIMAQPREISFPTKGIYEIQVYEIGENIKGIEKANERYKKYKSDHILPISAYRFYVK